MSETPDRKLDHDNVLEQAALWQAEGRRVALATVIETWGSAPRPVGSQLAIRDDAAFVGSVSGGCIEGDVVTRALDTLETGKPEILEYGVSDAKAWEVGLACGGRIRVFVEPVTG
ncbi:MAG: XdhC family protein [Parvibaculum sp.]|uniref:XdhC family protein n=1 Tax=Parvibaculum sp. TaxID=2024848 RepID=UPI003C793251